MVNVISTAAELGYLDVPKNIIIEMEQMKNYPPEKLVLITTGSQGEAMAALSRMAANLHRKVSIEPGYKRTRTERCKSNRTGYSCIGSCFAGGDKTYIFSYKT